MFNRSVHVYHHYESPPCETCGYRSNTGYPDWDGMHYHIIHTVQESDILLKKMLAKKDEPIESLEK